MLGLRGRTKDLNPFGGRPRDIFSAVKAAIDEMAAQHPWAYGQVERLNETVEEATVKRFHSDNHTQLKKHLAHLINA